MSYDYLSVPDQLAVVDERVLHAAVAAYLGQYRGESRVHTGSGLKVFLTWCAGEDLDPLKVGRAEVERYVRWLQEQVALGRQVVNAADNRLGYAFKQAQLPGPVRAPEAMVPHRL